MLEIEDADSARVIEKKVVLLNVGVIDATTISEKCQETLRISGERLLFPPAALRRL